MKGWVCVLQAPRGAWGLPSSHIWIRTTALMKSKGPKGRRCPVCFQNFWLPSLAVEGTSLRKVTFPAKSLWDEAWVSVGLGSKVVSTPSSGFIKMTTHRPLCQNAGIHLKTPATNASCKVRDFCWGLRGSWLHDPLHGVEPGSGSLVPF